MTEVIYHVATTTDHFIAGPNGEADESIFRDDPEVTTDFLEAVQQYDIVLMGKNTYEYGFQFGLKPGEPSGVALAVDPEMKHYIFSQSLDFPSNDRVELIGDHPVDFVQKLKSKGDKKIWLCGGGKLAGTLLDAGLIDKLILKTNPLILGNGIPLFGASQKKIRLNLTKLKTYPSDIIVTSYDIVYE